ncbi:MAG: beta-lactamase family protein [Phycisphaerales bacterium]|nr:beta-lactamase family protein [Phycisphaerales bacterium]
MINRPKTLLTSLVLGLLLATAATAAPLKPLADWMKGLVESGQVVGCMAQITQDGETIFLEAYGKRTPKSDDALGTDQVIRIYSMTKAITSAAVMQLVEQGKIGLDDPVSMYIPEFKDVQVLVDGELEPARREVTIRDLLTHTSGFTYGFLATPAIAPYYRGKLVGTKNLEEAATRIAGMPLLTEPGSAFVYGLSTDVLGRVVEVGSGMSFGEYLKENIFTPLEMDHTAFVPPADLEPMHIVTPADGQLVIDEAHYSRENNIFKPDFESGGGGLWSTIGDYSRFCMAMVNLGELDRQRILKASTVVFMTQNHLGPGVAAGPGQRFGLGFGIEDAVETSQGPRGAGRWTWGGAACTYFFIDPRQKLTAVFATQQFPFNMQMAGDFNRIVLESVAQEDAAQQ